MSFSDPRNEPIEAVPVDEPEYGRTSGSGGCWKGCALGCLVVFLLTVVVGVIAGWYAYRNGKQWATTAARAGVEQALADTELPQDEKDAILAQVDRLVVAAKERRLSWEALAKAGERVQQSPLFAAWMVFAAETKYIQPSGLSDDEKRDATRTLQRILRGLHDKSMSLQQLEPLQAAIMVDNGKGEPTLKEQLTDEELRKFLADCRQIADTAGVPDENFEITISQELKQFIDEILGESTSDTHPEESVAPTEGAVVHSER